MTLTWQDWDVLVLDMNRGSKPKRWIRGNTTIGPVLEVKVTNYLKSYGIIIKIDSMQNDGNQSWIVISRGINKNVTELPEENEKPIHYEDVAPGTVKLVATKRQEQFVPSSSHLRLLRSHFGSSHFGSSHVGSSHVGSSQGGNRITVEVHLTGFLFAYDVVMSGLGHGQPKTTDGSAPLGTVGIQVDLVGLGQSQGYEERQPHAHVGVFGQPTMDVSRLFQPELRLARLLPQLQSRRQLWVDVEAVAVAVLQGSSASDFRGLSLG